MLLYNWKPVTLDLKCATVLLLVNLNIEWSGQLSKMKLVHGIVQNLTGYVLLMDPTQYVASGSVDGSHGP